MKKNTIKTFLPTLELVKSMTPSAQAAYLRKAPNELIKFLSNCALNTRIGIIDLSPDIFDQLKKYKKLVKKISQPKISLKLRRKHISQKGTYNKIFVPLIDVLINYTK